MPDDLRHRLLEEINKTGFPLELRVANRLRARGYHVATNVYFVDQDEGKGREVDIRALQNAFFAADNQECVIRHCLLIECKKSATRPWVFFTSPSVSYDQNLRGALVHGVRPSWIRSPEELTTFEAGHPWFRSREHGRSFFEAFSGGSEANQAIVRAVLSAIKACVETHESEFAAQNPEKRNAVFYYPLIVLEGELFTARLQRSQIVVAPVTQVSVSVHYRSAHYAGDERHTVLVVRESALPTVLTALDGWLKRCSSHLARRVTCFGRTTKEPHRRRRTTRSSEPASPAAHRRRQLSGSRLREETQHVDSEG